jgi:Secretion system C-terminal sorting domain/Beta-propeller repeat
MISISRNSIVLLSLITIPCTVSAQSVLWGKKFGNMGDERVNEVACDVSGNIISTGIFGAFTDFDPGPGVVVLPGHNDIFIQKLDSNGNFLWAKNIAGTSYYDEGTSIATDSTENIYITGYFSDSVDFDPGTGVHLEVTSGWSDANIFVLKLDPNGNFVWVKRFMGTNNGGSYKDKGNSIKIGKDGFVYVGGTYQGAHDFDPGPGTVILPNAGLSQGFVVKLDTTGNLIWANYTGIGSPFTTPTATCNSIDITNTGEVYMTGMRNVSDIFIAKYDSSGILNWIRTMNSTGTAEGLSVSVDNSGSVYTTGYFSGQVDFNPSPVASYTLSSGGNNLYNNIFISKLDSSGIFVWAKSIGSPYHSSLLYDDNGTDIKADGSGNIYVTGLFCLTADFDPNFGVFNITSYAYLDAFVLKLDTASNYIWVQPLGGTGNEIPLSITASNNDALVVAGTFNSNFFPVGSSYSGSDDAFVIRLGNNNISTNSIEVLPSEGLVYPNPSSNLITISANCYENAELIIYNTDSKLVRKEAFVSGYAVNIEDLTAGIYFYEIRIHNRICKNGKILKL